jgi:hypothetical protein
VSRKPEDLDPARTGVELGMARHMEWLHGAILLRINGRIYNVARKDARALGAALSLAAGWDAAPRFHRCGAPDPDGRYGCDAEIGHDSEHTWSANPEKRAARIDRPMRRWRFE